MFHPCPPPERAICSRDGVRHRGARRLRSSVAIKSAIRTRASPLSTPAGERGAGTVDPMRGCGTETSATWSVVRRRPWRRCRDRPSDPLDLAAVLTGAVEMARTEADAARVRIEADVPPLPLVRGSAAELAHVFGSLLLHAHEQMPDGGAIRVRAREDRGRVVVTIRDSGEGMNEEDLARLFDPFSGVAGESALGLSVAWGVMSRLGGSLQAQSRRGEGTVLTLMFPLAAPPRREAPRHAQKTRRRSTILIVDDEQDNLDVLREVLELEGQEVRCSRTGPEALALFDRGERFDLVLCDVGMPQMSGWQVAREIQRVAPGTAVWMLTGWANEIGESDPRRHYVRGVLAKPLDLEQLRSLLTPSPQPTAPEPNASALH